MKIIHPFSFLKNQKIIVKHSTGYNITDSKNNNYLDFVSCLYNSPLGYNNKKLFQNLFNDISNSHIFNLNPESNQSNIFIETLTKKLSEMILFGEYIFYTNSGAEANDIGIQFCLNENKSKYKIISYRNSYHGSTKLSVESSGNLNLTAHNNIFVDFFDKNSIFDKADYLNYFENFIINNDPSTINCFIAEPMIGANGGLIMKENVLPEMLKICQKYDIKFILDEVISGFGRLGKMFAYQKYNIEPDVLILSKQITNGYFPLGACILSKNFKSFDKKVNFGFTQSGSPVAAKLGLRSIDIISKINTDIIEHNLLKICKELLNFKIVYNYCLEGAFASIHFSKNKNFFNPFEVERNIGGEIANKLFQQGLIVRGNPKSIIFAPGYYFSEAEFDQVLAKIKIVLSSYE